MMVAGLLTKETNKLRTFSRTFVTVPQGDGIVIANELYHITNASPEQQEVITCTIFAVDHCLVCCMDGIRRQSCACHVTYMSTLCTSITIVVNIVLSYL